MKRRGLSCAAAGAVARPAAAPRAAASTRRRVACAIENIAVSFVDAVDSRPAGDDCSKQPPPGMTLPLRAPRTLDDLLNYRLLRLFALGGAPVIRLLEGRYGIARREWRVLALLAAHGGMSPSALAERAHL